MKLSKKILIIIFSLFVAVGSFALAGCKKSALNLIKDNLSEVTYSYYFQENEDFSLSISVGKREEPYYVDGYHGKVVDFSLLTFKDKTYSMSSKSINAKLVVDGKEKEICLTYNPIANAYMLDLGYTLKGDKICFEFAKKTLNLEKISNNFDISWQKALEISANYLSQKFEELKKGKLEGECYLKILGKRDNSNMGILWCFTVVKRDRQNYNLIISIENGNILASDI